MGRPGRIRYIKHFGNLSAKAVSDYLDDNLKDESKRTSVLRIVDILEISTIDILKSIVDEVNIHGDITENSLLNIPKGKIQFEFLGLHINKGRFEEIRNFIINQMGDLKTAAQCLKMPYKDNHSNEQLLYDKKSILVRHEYFEAESKVLYEGLETNNFVILQAPDEYGFFIYKNQFSNEEELGILLQTYDYKSLYKGLLI